MTAAIWTERTDAEPLAGSALNAAAKFWLLIAVAGQWAFVYYIAAFYGTSIAEGNFQAWTRNENLIKGYVAGDTVGNLSFAAHAMLAAVIAFGGILQLLPRMRARYAAVHRWNGRIFLLANVMVSITGLYLVWVRGTDRSVASLGITLNAVLMLAFSWLAWRTAVARDFVSHRRWALRGYIVANGQWFFRVGIFAWVLLVPRHAGVGVFYLVWTAGCYLVPLTVLEFYLRARDGGGPRAQSAMAASLLGLTILMGAGIVGVSLIMWRPLL